MSDSPTVNDMMEAYAADAVDHARVSFGVALDYSPESVRQVEHILERFQKSIPRRLMRFIKRSPSEEELDTVCKMYGGYIGEVFRRTYGGTWELRNDVPGASAPVITLNRPGGDSFFPPSKVAKRITDGEGDDVWFYFRVLSERATNPAA